MQRWIVTIVGVLLLTVLCDIVLPEGKTAKYTKMVMALIAISVVAGSIVMLFSGDTDALAFSENESNHYEVNKSYIDYVFSSRMDYYEKCCEDVLIANAYDANVKITVEATNYQQIITSARIKLSVENGCDLAIIEEMVNKVGNIVANYLNVDKGVISICLE